MIPTVFSIVIVALNKSFLFIHIHFIPDIDFPQYPHKPLPHSRKRTPVTATNVFLVYSEIKHALLA